MMDEHIYRLSWFRVWLTFSIVGQLIFLLPGAFIVIYLIIEDRRDAFSAAVWINIVSLALALAATFVYCLTWKIIVFPEGMKWRDSSGVSQWSTWNSFGSAKKSSLFYLKYARIVTTREPRGIWIPLFLSHRERFIETVARFAGQDHPFCRVLEEEPITDTY